MIYKAMTIKHNVKNFSKKKKLAVLDFIFDGENLDKSLQGLLKNRGIKISELDKQNFLSTDTNELIVPNLTSNNDLNVVLKLNIEKITSDTFRNYLAGFISKLKSRNILALHINLLSFNKVKQFFAEEEHYLKSMIEGLLLGNYNFDKYKSDKKVLTKLEINLNYESKKSISGIIKHTSNLIESVYFSRDLVNEPANFLTPAELVKQSKKELTKFGVKVSAINKAGLKKQKMNAILAVGSASINDPHLLIMHYKPKGKAVKKIALVGKGVTYDSGGLSIKPTAGMLEMKADMSGSATVIGTILAAAKNQLPVELIGVVPAVENMLAGNSYKPGDIITSYSGKTILVKDTDAEGRVVLADALTYACKQKPDQIIDFATLTGAVAVALGLFTAGVMTKFDSLSEDLVKAGERANEPLWRLPFNDDYSKLIETDIADVSNLGPRWGGAITAGKFLEFFVDKDIPYAHIDLAGPALEHKYRNYTEKWCTGFGIRMMDEYLTKL
jgi:leucyl aminopeptidase